MPAESKPAGDSGRCAGGVAYLVGEKPDIPPAAFNGHTENPLVTGGGSGTPTGDAASTPEQTALMRWKILCRHIEDGVPLTTLAAREGIGLRTLQRWRAAHKRAGLSGLATSNRGTTRRRTAAELVALVEGLALVKPTLPVAGHRPQSQPRRRRPRLAAALLQHGPLHHHGP